MLDDLKQQYSYIRLTRQTLFEFLEEIPLQKLHNTVPNFGSGSIIKTHIHVADCYRYWLGSYAFKQKRIDFSFATHNEIERSDVKWIRDRFKFNVQQFVTLLE